MSGPDGALATWLARWRPDLSQVGVLCDFDGTLAPIVADPAQARALPGTDAALRRLSARCACVGIVSGRPAAYLLARLPDAGVTLCGLYGLERVEAGRVVEVPGASRWRAVVAEVAGAAEAARPDGVGVEHKGLSVTLHTRTAPSATAWAQAWAEEAAARSGLAVHLARMSVELRPPLAVDKGSVVGELGTGLAAVCFFGDDRGDLPAFAALGALRAAGADTVAVAVRSDETPDELLTAADAAVDGPEAVLALLQQLGDG